MTPDWNLVQEIAKPTIAGFVGAAINRMVEKKTKLIAYFTHATEFHIPGDNPSKVHTHGIIIKNNGSKPATDIRLRHNFLPQLFNVYPKIQYSVESLPNGGSEIVFPRLVANEQVSIAYLYFPPIFYNQIHAGICHSEGFAVEVTALPTEQNNLWMIRGTKLLVFIGIISSTYAVIKLAAIAYKFFLQINN